MARNGIALIDELILSMQNARASFSDLIMINYSSEDMLKRIVANYDPSLTRGEDYRQRRKHHQRRYENGTNRATARHRPRHGHQ